ncbi:MAG TPA: hypothetical protein VMT94_02280 [Burkholderiales bacterium]|nr:hypothetical protein [Burkholderiales bacterium]
MTIERDSQIQFDPEGTLRATSSWISKHDEGLAELLKNALYAYDPRRANVAIQHCVAAILLVDGEENAAPARIGVLDVGGATLEDVDRWSVWQDLHASRLENATQGNGGKAYLYRMFEGEARLFGVKEGKRRGDEDPLPPPPPRNYGTIPATIDIERANETLKVGRGVTVPLEWFLRPSVRDAESLPVRAADLIYISDNPRIACFPNPKEGVLVAKEKGICSINIKLKGSGIESAPVHIDVCVVDHVLLTPRNLQIPLGKNEGIVAEVTTDEGERSTDILLNWEHDADDPMTVRIRPTGVVIGSRLGQTTVAAGAGDRTKGGVWARVRAEVEIVPNPNLDRRGGGFPTLKVTDRDIDPETGEKRQSELWERLPS